MAVERCCFCCHFRLREEEEESVEAAEEDEEQDDGYSVDSGDDEECKVVTGVQKECQVCFEERRPDDIFIFSGKCQHSLCLGCAVRHVRSADMVRGGIRCPMLRSRDGQRCRARMNYDELTKLSEASRKAAYDITSPYFSFVSTFSVWLNLEPSSDHIALRKDEMDTLERLYIRMAFTKKKEMVCFCPACGECFAASTQNQKNKAHCSNCNIEFCAHCCVPWHHGLSCDQYQAQPQLNDAKTQEVVRRTSKHCPGCTSPITHLHGHGCHHISPVTNGCPHCHTHFCYACLETAQNNEKVRGQRSKCLCGGWSKFCKDDNIQDSLSFIQTEDGAYIAYDIRCGCPLCSTCKPMQPCSLCDGSCVICTGKVPSSVLQPS